MNLASWREATRVRVKLLYAVMRSLYDQVSGPGTFLVSATRLGGAHGYDEAGAVAPLGGCVTGFTKAFKREKSEALVKVVDFEPSRKTSALADLLVDETLSDPGAVEIGYKNGQRLTVGLEEIPAADGNPGIVLNKDSVFVITGAAGSIVSAITADLAAASGGVFHLLDLAPEPDPASSDLRRFTTDKEGLKRDIFERLKARGERATPAMVEKELAMLERCHAALSAIEAVKQAGGTPHYYSVNLLDAEGMGRVVKQVAEKSGRIDVLIHAGGIEISHFLPDKKPSEFDLVFDIKSDGWFHLLSNLGGMPLGAAVVFSSVAGRFGNGAQTDYSSANDLLCKSISSFRTTRPETRGIAVDWTAWGGIGMATRGSIPVMMKQAGIDMLDPAAGIPTVRRELTAGATRGEVVVAQKLGIMMNEFDESGGLDVRDGGRVSALLERRGIMTGKIVGMGLHSGLVVEATLDPSEQPFLHDHQIGGTPVLPGVMGIEAMAEVARLLFPERQVGSIEDIHFYSPFKFYRSQPRTVTLQADFAAQNGEIVANCRLIGSRTLHGQSQAETTVHFTSKVRLVEGRELGKRDRVCPPADSPKIGADDVYHIYFHGPAYRVVNSAWKTSSGLIGMVSPDLPPNHVPSDLETLVSPRLIELCFQTAGLWELASQAKMGLPYGIDQVKVMGLPDATELGLFAVVTPKADGSFDAELSDGQGNVYLSFSGYRTMQLPESVDAGLLKPLQAVLG